eukprot:28791_1
MDHPCESVQEYNSIKNISFMEESIAFEFDNTVYTIYSKESPNDTIIISTKGHLSMLLSNDIHYMDGEYEYITANLKEGGDFDGDVEPQYDHTSGTVQYKSQYTYKICGNRCKNGKLVKKTKMFQRQWSTQKLISLIRNGKIRVELKRIYKLGNAVDTFDIDRIIIDSTIKNAGGSIKCKNIWNDLRSNMNEEDFIHGPEDIIRNL